MVHLLYKCLRVLTYVSASSTVSPLLSVDMGAKTCKTLTQQVDGSCVLYRPCVLGLRHSR